MRRIPICGSCIVVLLTILASASFASDEYSVQSEFGDSTSCDCITQGIYIVWWDNRNDLASEASVLLDSMSVYREICLDTMCMQDPPNPQDGFYFNIYLHEQGDVFPDGWSCGVGTDSYGYPYLTLPIGVLGNWMTISHETFHIFQYSCTAEGFGGDDCFWFVEASANWFAAITHPGDPDSFVEAMALVKVPQVAMWLGYDNFPAYYPENWQRYCHQYAMALFLYYLTEMEGYPRSIITSGFYTGAYMPQNLNPQQYLVQLLGLENMRELFMNWAAHLMNDFDIILPEQLETAQYHWSNYGDPQDDNQFTMVFQGGSSGSAYAPPDSLVTTAWSFNTFKVTDLDCDDLTFSLWGNPTGSQGDPSCFRGRVLVRNTFSGTRFYDLQMESCTDGNVTVDIMPADTVAYFIVGSLPEIYDGSEEIFPYMISVQPDLSLSGGDTGSPDSPCIRSASNPAGPGTAIEFFLPCDAEVTITLYDVSGRLVKTLFKGDLQGGDHEIPLVDGNGCSQTLSPGFYFLLLRAADQMSCTKLVLL